MPPNARWSIPHFSRIATPSPWLALALLAGYFTAASLSVTAFGTNTPIWVSNGLVVAALLRHKLSAWPWLLLAAAIADFGANALYGDGPAIAVAVVGCDILEIVLVAALLSRWLGSEAAQPFTSIGKMTQFALVCLLVPVISGGAGAGMLALTHGAPFLTGWRTWSLASTFGLLIVVPLLLGWTDAVLRADRSNIAILQTLVLAGLVALIGLVDFNDQRSGLFLTFPFLLIATFQGRLLGATTAVAALTAVATWSTLQGYAEISVPLADPNTLTQIQILQLNVLVVLLSTLPVATVLEQRERLSASLLETTRKAQAAAQAKSDFLAAMSHEIRTPMTSVLGLADLLMQMELPEKQRHYVTEIRNSGQYLLTLINDILDFSRIEAGKIQLEKIDFAIPAVLEQVRSLLAPQAAKRGLELHFDLDPHSPAVVRGDPTRLIQILINLVGNGLKFTRQGGVTVSVCHDTQDAGHERFRFEVRDTGIGIPKESQGLLFNAFSQGDSSTTRHYGGSGLGLAISRRLVEAMGGAIGVESVSGIGSRFWFEAPLERGDVSAVQAAAREALAFVPPQRLLLVEDVATNQELIAAMLRSHGHEVSLASNGKEAVKLATEERFDIILMDVQMPEMDGIEATHRIRMLPPPAGEVPILALSANVMASERERYLTAGMNDALAKPVDWPKLFAALARYASGGTVTMAQSETSYPSPESETSAPAIETAALNRLRNLQGGTGDLTLKLSEIFVHDTTQRLQDLSDAVHRMDAPAVARIAHAIRGSAANLGAQLMVQICQGIETRAEVADLSSATARLSELKHEFVRACDALAATPQAN
jgi:signal transduction histidine kinase/DNA-binding response OmpR family regulator